LIFLYSFWFWSLIEEFIPLNPSVELLKFDLPDAKHFRESPRSGCALATSDYSIKLIGVKHPRAKDHTNTATMV
jgi:hypothetical protein